MVSQPTPGGCRRDYRGRDAGEHDSLALARHRPLRERFASARGRAFVLCYHRAQCYYLTKSTSSTPTLLLNDPEVLYSFSGGEVVVPAVVLKELDNLKRRRTDRRVRYHGRKATRLLFEISQNGRLLDGVTLSNGSVLRVDPPRSSPTRPAIWTCSGQTTRSWPSPTRSTESPGVHTTLVTNDLNMLLRGRGDRTGRLSLRGQARPAQGKEQRGPRWSGSERRDVTLVLGTCSLWRSPSVHDLSLQHPARGHRRLLTAHLR